MLSIARGLANVITDGQQIVGYPDWFTALSTHGISASSPSRRIVLILLLVAGWAFLRYRPGGRALYAIGGSQEVARLAGIKVKQTTDQRLRRRRACWPVSPASSSPPGWTPPTSAAVGIELDIIAAVVIGGASLERRRRPHHRNDRRRLDHRRAAQRPQLARASRRSSSRSSSASSSPSPSWSTSCVAATRELRPAGTTA